jgi:hypothetical protein
MGAHSPRVKHSLEALRTAAARSSPDLVEVWKARARASLLKTTRDGKPRVSWHVSFGFVLVAGLLGAGTGRFGSWRSLALLASVLLVHESARALLCRTFGRSCHVSISIFGGQTEVSGPPLDGSPGLAVATVGSLANALVALLLFIFAQRTHDPSWATELRELSVGHALWAAAQALPLAPFRLGAELARHLSPSLRRTHAIASGGLAVGLVVAIFRLPKLPLLTFTLTFVALSVVRVAFDAIKEERDEQTGVDEKSSEAEAALAAGDVSHAIRIARGALDVARSIDQRHKLWRTLAWAAIAQSDPFLAHLALQHLPQADVDLYLLCSYLMICGRNSEAEELLQEARGRGQRSPETSKQLIELLFSRGDRVGARALSEHDADLLSPADQRVIAAALALSRPAVG